MSNSSNEGTNRENRRKNYVHLGFLAETKQCVVFVFFGGKFMVLLLKPSFFSKKLNTFFKISDFLDSEDPKMHRIEKWGTKIPSYVGH